jgi:NAD+ diphosphatase
MRHFYASDQIDRVAQLRGDADWVRARLADEDSRFVPVWRSRLFVDMEREGEDPPRPVLLTVAQASTLAHDLQEGSILLGTLEGATYFAVDLSDIESPEEDSELAGHGHFVSLRRIGPFIDRRNGGLLAYAQAMVHWHQQHRFCGTCGSPTRSEEAGHWLRCTSDQCRTLHFPRTDPAMIVRVTHDDRCLLGRQSRWPARRYSVLAGFVEPGESLEDAVIREVFEEAGVRVDDVQYHSSQPWPFPASLMIGFTANARDDSINIDADELEEARWFSRDQLDDEVAAGDVILPSEIALAHHLINGWYRRDRETSIEGKPWTETEEDNRE